jgi:ABC-2 type transport system ATP-binding protein
MSAAAIEVSGLRYVYGRQEVLRGVDLEVPAGSVFGFLGRNGAGKTTTIKVLLGLLRPARGQGSCRVLGLDPGSDAQAVRRAVGYLAEDQEMYGWMTVAEIVRWIGSFYPTWDPAFVSARLDAFGLPRQGKVQALSKGQNTRLALLLALGHRPRLVILDDPTLGLDPIARKEFLRLVIELLQGDGVTVFFSSHLLYEIEPVVDHVAILDQGAIVKAGPTEALRESVRRCVLVPRPDADFATVPGVLDLVRSGTSVAVTLDACNDARRALLRELSAHDVEEQALNLDEIFAAYVAGNRGK